MENKQNAKQAEIKKLVEFIEKKTGKKVIFEKKKTEDEKEEAEKEAGFEAGQGNAKKFKKDVKKKEKEIAKTSKMESRVDKIRKIKSLVEMIERKTGKKVVFKEADSPSKALENWAGAHKFPKGEKTKETVQSIMSHLKDSGYSIVATPKNEKAPTKSSGGGLKEAAKTAIKKGVKQVKKNPAADFIFEKRKARTARLIPQKKKTPTVSLREINAITDLVNKK